MSEYRKISGKAGIRYLKNNKLVSVKNIPKDVLKNLTEDNVVGEQGVKPTPNSKACIFCGKWGNKTKFINMQTIVLCDEDYQNKTTGQVAEQLRKDSDGQEKESKESPKVKKDDETNDETQNEGVLV